MIIQTFYIPFGEKCNCWKPQISGIDYNILGIKIWIARMIQITSQITLNIFIKNVSSIEHTPQCTHGNAWVDPQGHRSNI